MFLEIHGHHFPGRSWQVDGNPFVNLQVGVQVRREPHDLVPADSDSAVWSVEIQVVETADGLDFRGPAVQGRRGDRFVYLTWGEVQPDGSFAIVRRAKLMLNDLTSLGDLSAAETTVVARIDLTDERGGPRCARLAPPALELTCG